MEQLLRRRMIQYYHEHSLFYDVEVEPVRTITCMDGYYKHYL